MYLSYPTGKMISSRKLAIWSSCSKMIDIFSEPFTSELTNDTNKKRAFAKSVEGVSPSDLKTVFDRVKVRCVLKKEMIIPVEALLNGVYAMKSKDRSERDYVRFLSEYGIGLRKIKSYLSETVSQEEEV